MAKEYNFPKTSTSCARCNKELVAGDDLVATLKETDHEFTRDDYCPSCWDAESAQLPDSVVGFWRSRVAPAQQKKKLLVDDDILMNFFQRLQDAREDQNVCFRFVIALAMMRKKLLVYEGMTKDPSGTDIWKMRVRGLQDMHEVTDPHMDQDKIAQVSQHLGQILEGQI